MLDLLSDLLALRVGRLLFQLGNVLAIGPADLLCLLVNPNRSNKGVKADWQLVNMRFNDSSCNLCALA